MVRLCGRVASQGMHTDLGGQTGNHPLGRLIRRWEDNIKMDLRDILVYIARI
jgi:hypothetical protein